MPKLTQAAVHRSGRTARTWNFESNKVEINCEKDKFAIRFSLSSKGGGITDVKVTIGVADYAAVFRATAETNRGDAMREMSAILAKELANQSEHDSKMIRLARTSVVDEAETAFNEAPAGRDHAERLTWDMVQQLVKRLNDKDKAAQNADDSE